MLVPFLQPVRARPAAPEVDHGLAVDHDRTSGTQFFFLAEILCKGFVDWRKLLVADAPQAIGAAARLDRFVEIEVTQNPLPVSSFTDSNDR